VSVEPLLVSLIGFLESQLETPTVYHEATRCICISGVVGVDVERKKYPSEKSEVEFSTHQSAEAGIAAKEEMISDKKATAGARNEARNAPGNSRLFLDIFIP